MQFKISRIVLLFTLLVTQLISCKKEEAPKEVLRPVRYQQIYSTGGSRVRTFSGVAKAGTESKLSFKVAGTVEIVAVKVGDKVKTGQLLSQMDPVDYELKAKEAEAGRDQARALEIQAKANYERVQSLYENRNASKADLDAARANFESAHEQDNILKKRRNLARRQLEYTKLTAPVSGAISEVRVEANENVNSGQTMFVLTSGSQLEVEVAIPEILISQIRQGQSVMALFDAITGKNFKATVTEVGVAATGFATTYPVIVHLDETHPDIRSGMAVEVSFSFKATSQKVRFVVPPFSVSEDSDGRFVFVVEAGEENIGLIKKKTVELGDLTDDGLEVLEGLKDGDYLVTAGVSRILDGQKVKFEIVGIK